MPSQVPHVDYIGLFDWTRSDLIFELKAAYEQALEKIAIDVLEAAEEHDIKTALSSLAVERRSRVLTAPVLAWNLSKDVKCSSLPILYSSLLEELTLEAYSERTIECSVRGSYSSLLNTDLLDEKKGTLIGTPIRIDTLSPFKFPDDQDDSLFSAPSEAEGSVALRRLVFALQILSEFNPNAHKLVVTYLDTIALRFTRNDSRFESSTFSGYAGLVRLSNLHADNVGDVDLIEALVHESIHSVLYIDEIRFGDFIRNEELKRQILISPWSGASITLSSFVHACMVWYGIACLWRDNRTTSSLCSRDMNSRYEIARSGFSRRPVSRTLRPYQHDIRPNFFMQLLEAEQVMAPP